MLVVLHYRHKVVFCTMHFGNRVAKSRGLDNGTGPKVLLTHWSLSNTYRFND